VKSMPQFPDMPDVEWACFVCTACGRETFYGLDDDLDAESQQLVVDMLFGDPPVCTGCQSEARL
jgi:hypothetical protein